MTNTALGAGAEKAQEIIFISEAHEKFYYKKYLCGHCLRSLIWLKIPMRI